MPSPLSKRIAGRVTGACGHSVPVSVPCTDCVERQLDGWEQRIRDECKKEALDAYKQAMESAARVKERADYIEKKYGAMETTISNLKEANEALAGIIKTLRREKDDLRAQLHAEQAVMNVTQHTMTGGVE